MTDLDRLKKLRDVTELAVTNLRKDNKARRAAIERAKQNIFNLQRDIETFDEYTEEYLLLLEDLAKKIKNIGDQKHAE